jgi:hypothetical protein
MEGRAERILAYLAFAARAHARMQDAARVAAKARARSVAARDYAEQAADRIRGLRTR